MSGEPTWLSSLPRNRVLVTGMAATGQACATYLAQYGAQVTTFDDGGAPADLRDANAVNITDFDLVVTSPGLPPHHPVLTSAVQNSVPVWSEIELAWQARVPNRKTGVPAPWLALTGTNGKTTTVGMLTSILSAAGLNAAEVGNVGPPVIGSIEDSEVDVFAIELSSSQLHFVHSMQAQAAAVLNLAPDHLTWHADMSEYAQAKGRIFQQVERACVFNVADQQTRDLVERADVQEGARGIGFTLNVPGPGELGLVQDALVDRAFAQAGSRLDPRDEARLLATFQDLGHLAGPDGELAPHILRNALAAAALARAHGVSPDAVAQGLRNHQNAAHRIQLVAKVAGVTYYDDSKATNTHAAQAALQAFEPGSVVWIAGGLTKGASFDDFIQSQVDRLRAVVLIGVDREVIRDALGRHAPQIPLIEIDHEDTGTVMARAVAAASSLAAPNTTVLLSPACASMDQFRSYEHRGEVFAAEVRRVAQLQE